MVDTKSEVLVTGATGAVGAEVVAYLVGQGVRVRAMTRAPEKADLPEGATAVAGELSDPDAVREALTGVDGLFLLSPVGTEELTGTLLTLDIARELGTRAIVYLSVIHADRFTEPPHFAAKDAAERMILDLDLPATSLRPGYYMQNDVAERAALLDEGVYRPPLGTAGVLAIDVRDLGAVGGAALLARLSASTPPDVLDVVAPETLTGESIASIWAEVLDRPVRYGGDDLDGVEKAMRQSGAPGWLARDMRLMFQRFERDGMVADPGAGERLAALLGRPPRSYREFATETARSWQNA